MVAGGRYVLGPEVEAFEERFAAYVGVRHCVGVACGLDALHLSLLALGIGPGDEVLVPANTYIATWLAVTRAGATAVPVEPDPSTGNIDPGRLEAAITPRTRAIVPVHLYGLPAEMDAILRDRRGATACACWRTPPRPTARATAGGRWAASATPARGASTRARTSARSATAAP